MDVKFSYEDDKYAGIWRFVCNCGHVISEGGGTVEDGEVIECPKCRQKYKFVWKGMTVEVGGE